MIYSTDTLKKSLNKSIKNNINESNNSIGSLFEDNLNYNTDNYKPYIIDKPQSDISGIKDYINNRFTIINPLKTIVEEFVSSNNNINDKYFMFEKDIENDIHLIYSNKDILREYNDSIIYPYKYITFSNLSNDKLGLFSSCINFLYTELKNTLNNIFKDGTYESIYNNIIQCKDTLTPVDEFLSIFKSKLLEVYGEISEDNFIDTLYYYFRSKEDDDIVLSSNKIRQSYNDFIEDLNQNKFTGVVERIIREYKNRISEPIISNSYIETEITENIIHQLNYIYSNFINKTQGVCTIYNQYHSTRLDAIKDNKIQSINILTSAIRKYKGNSINISENKIMSSIEEYNLFYEMFMAEQEMIESLLEIRPLAEDNVGLEILSEGIKDTVLKYLTKVSGGLSVVWDKFKGILNSGKNKAYLKMISGKIDSAEGNFTIENFPRYNMDKIDNIKIQPFNYEDMKESLSNRNDFIKKYYPMLDSNEGSIKQSIENLVIDSRSDTRCDNDLIKRMYDFCINSYDSKIDSIEDDLKKVNDSNKNIERIVSTITTTEESYLPLIESYLLEEDDKKKVEFKDDPNKDAKDKSDKLLKDVVTFTKVSTEICTGKMNVVKDCYNLYIKCLRHAISDNKDNKETTDNTADTGKVDTQVDLN